MSIAVMVIGESGTGKTASLQNLKPADALLIQSVKKPLSFRSTEWKYYAPGVGGNIMPTDDSETILAVMKKTKKKIIIIDDWQYILANEFMRRSAEVGFGKFNEIGRHAWDILMAANQLPDDVRVYILGHSVTDESGHTRLKTIGKMLDDKITCEGLVTICLKTLVSDGDYKFTTRNSGYDTVKTPIGLFSDATIPNDLAEVDKAICNYYGITAATTSTTQE